MTEADWLACNSADRMLTFLRGKASDRQLRLVACAIARQLWDKLDRPESRSAIAVTEQVADGLVSPAQLKSAWSAACLIFSSAGGMEAAGVAANCAYTKAAEAATGTANHAASQAGIRVSEVVGAIREIVGNPFRPSRINATWLVANDSAVVRVAEAIYSEQDFDRIGILADALEDLSLIHI